MKVFYTDHVSLLILKCMWHKFTRCDIPMKYSHEKFIERKYNQFQLASNRFGMQITRGLERSNVKLFHFHISLCDIL